MRAVALLVRRYRVSRPGGNTLDATLLNSPGLPGQR